MPSQESLPAWRRELNERVKAVRERRNNPVPTAADEVSQSEAAAGALAEAELDPRHRSRQIARREAATIATASGAGQPQPRLPQSPNEAIVEKALTRVRRATENAHRAALPKIEPARPVQRPSLSLEREATARVLTPELELAPAAEIPSLPEVFEPPPAPRTHAVSVEPRPDYSGEAAAPAEDAYQTAPLDIGRQSTKSLYVPDEIEPRDYLEAEIRKVDKVLSQEFARNESPSFVVHLVLNFIDLLAIGLSSLPFIAMIELANGNFAETYTRVAAAGMVVLVAIFYLGLTQCLGGKTFGMMMTNTRVVDAYTFDEPSASKMLVRTLGYFLAAAPALLGFLLGLVFQQKRRGLHDLISGTQVARDF